MADDTTRTSRQTSRRRRRFTLRRNRLDAPVPSGLLTVAGRPLAPIDFLENPLAAVAGVEDVCWQFARRDWLERRPPRYRLAERRAWRDEGDELDEKRARIVEMIDDRTGRGRP